MRSRRIAVWAGCTLALLTACTAVPLPAAMHDGREVQGTAGWLHVSGTMHERPCQLAMPSRWQTVSLVPVTSAELTRPGDAGEAVPFHLRLEGCIRSAGTVADQSNNTLSWSDWQPLATVTFSGEADASLPALFKVQGVEGIGLRLRDAGGHALLPGKKSRPMFLSTGENVLYFSIAPERTASGLIAGGYSAVLDFRIDYQ